MTTKIKTKYGTLTFSNSTPLESLKHSILYLANQMYDYGKKGKKQEGIEKVFNHNFKIVLKQLKKMWL